MAVKASTSSGVRTWRILQTSRRQGRSSRVAAGGSSRVDRHLFLEAHEQWTPPAASLEASCGCFRTARHASRIIPRRGMLVVFPADTLHEVTPVADGHRDTVVDWFS